MHEALWHLSIPATSAAELGILLEVSGLVSKYPELMTWKVPADTCNERLLL